MPVFTALTGFVVSGLTAIGVPAALAGAGANLIIGTTLSFASSLLAPKPKAPDQDFKAVLNQATAERLRGYDTRRVGGTRAFFDSKDGTLYQVILLHHGEIDEFLKYWIGDTEVEIDADGWVQTPPWIRSSGSKVRILTRTGWENSPAYDEMTSVWGSAWTEAHQLKGIATACVIFYGIGQDNFNLLYPQGHSTPVTFTIRMSRVYDPRAGIWVARGNPALCIRDYLLSSDGYRLTADFIDEDSFSAFADVCDVMIDRNHGADERRYEMAGLYSLQDDPKDVLARMRATCDAELYETEDGKVGIHGGVWVEPALTIDADHILSYELDQGADKFAAFNELKITYSSEVTDTGAEAPKWKNAADQEIRGVISAQIDLDMVTSPSQAQRLAKIYQAKQNPQWRGMISTDLSGLLARDQRTIRVVLPELSIDQSFLVTSHGIRADLTGCEIGISSLDASAYAWNAATEEGVETPAPEVTKPNTNLPVPVLTLTQEVRDFTAGSSAPVIIATATASTRDDLALRAQYRLAEVGSWEAMQVADLRAVSGAVVEGEAYEVRASWTTAKNTAGDWSEPAPITIAVS